MIERRHDVPLLESKALIRSGICPEFLVHGSLSAKIDTNPWSCKFPQEFAYFRLMLCLYEDGRESPAISNWNLGVLSRRTSASDCWCCSATLNPPCCTGRWRVRSYGEPTKERMSLISILGPNCKAQIFPGINRTMEYPVTIGEATEVMMEEAVERSLYSLDLNLIKNVWNKVKD